MNIAEIKDVVQFINDGKQSAKLAKISLNLCKYYNSLNFCLIKFLFFIRGFITYICKIFAKTMFLISSKFFKKKSVRLFLNLIVASI